MAVAVINAGVESKLPNHPAMKPARVLSISLLHCHGLRGLPSITMVAIQERMHTAPPVEARMNGVLLLLKFVASTWHRQGSRSPEVTTRVYIN